MADLDDATIDELFGTLSKYIRIRERAAHLTLYSEDGPIESAAYKCLFQLAEQSMRSSRLAEIMVTDPSTVSRHVATLVELGYVRREADPADGRATLLVATESGMARADEIRRHRRGRLQTLLDGWTGDELDSLVTLLARFVDAAEELLLPTPCAAPGRIEGRTDGPAVKRKTSHDK